MASVGAEVTSHHWGFAQGFDAYFDDMGSSRDTEKNRWRVERPHGSSATGGSRALGSSEARPRRVGSGDARGKTRKARGCTRAAGACAGGQGGGTQPRDAAGPRAKSEEANTRGGQIASLWQQATRGGRGTGRRASPSVAPAAAREQLKPDPDTRLPDINT